MSWKTKTSHNQDRIIMTSAESIVQCTKIKALLKRLGNICMGPLCFGSPIQGFQACHLFCKRFFLSTLLTFWQSSDLSSIFTTENHGSVFHVVSSNMTLQCFHCFYFCLSWSKLKPLPPMLSSLFLPQACETWKQMQGWRFAKNEVLVRPLCNQIHQPNDFYSPAGCWLWEHYAGNENKLWGVGVICLYAWVCGVRVGSV